MQLANGSGGPGLRAPATFTVIENPIGPPVHMCKRGAAGRVPVPWMRVAKRAT